MELNIIYLSLMGNPQQSITNFIDIILTEIIDNDTAPTSLLRVAIKTLIKVFENIDPNIHLLKKSENYDPQFLINALINC